MADDITLPGTGAKVATDDDGTRHWQWYKAAWGANDVYNKVDTAAGMPLPVQTAAGKSAIHTITRPANQTPYGAADVLGGALTFTGLCLAAGEHQIVSAQLEADIAAIPTGMTTFRLALYNVTPPSAIADNGVFDLPSGDRASWLGIIPLGTLVDLVSTLYCENNGITKQFLAAGTAIYGYLITDGAFTPAANSEVYKVTLHTIPVT